MIRVLLISITILISGCATVSVQLPEPSEHTIRAAEATIADASVPSPQDFNSVEAYEILDKIFKRMEYSAAAICIYLTEDDCRWHVGYEESTDINAYATGESLIIIYKGILQHVRSEDEIAFAMAHEMAHHIANHFSETRENAKVGAWIGYALSTGIVVGSGYFDSSSESFKSHVGDQLINSGTRFGAEIGALRYSKQQEREADYLAAYITARAGYNLDGAERLLLTMGKADKQGLHRFQGFLNTHPAGSFRLAALRQTRDEIQGNTNLLPILKNGRQRQIPSILKMTTFEPIKLQSQILSPWPPRREQMTPIKITKIEEQEVYETTLENCRDNSSDYEACKRDVYECAKQHNVPARFVLCVEGACVQRLTLGNEGEYICWSHYREDFPRQEESQK